MGGRRRAGFKPEPDVYIVTPSSRVFATVGVLVIFLAGVATGVVIGLSAVTT